jgi:site-specific DNA-methyltransferase (adenine-specific)|tara:strand:- start:3428 stop:5122 length:1695 start_codon:yes stop_codon:yes gene_type:complete
MAGKKKKESIGEYVDIDSLVEWEHNPRINTEAVSKVARSIERFGFASPVIAREEDSMVIAGHTRIAAARSLGLQTVPVRYMKLSRTEAELLAIADNKLGEISDWNEDMLKDILTALPENDLDDIGFSQDELDSLLENIDTELPPESDNAVYDTDYDDADNLDLERVKIAEEGGIYAVGDQYVLCGDCVEILRSFPDNSIDSIVCDPPYGIGFMGKDWDHSVPTEEWARECFRVLKPGGHIVAFGATRAIHRMVCALEDEGFEIRDMINWLYFSGFPKSMDISKQIDKMKGVEREVVGEDNRPKPSYMLEIGKTEANTRNITKPATEEAQYWEGWGTALKPAQEPAILCRKPIEKGLNVSENVLKWGTGAINIDACRFGYGDPCWVGSQEQLKDHNGFSSVYVDPKLPKEKADDYFVKAPEGGRWPANIYQCAKPSRSERETGLDDLESKKGHEAVHRKEGTAGLENPRAGAGRTASEVKNFHPTVKPTKLMAWLCRLLTPKGGIVLDTFLGSGTTGVSASMEGFKFIGTEMNPEYCDIALQRIKHATGHDIMKVEGVIFEVSNV